MECQARVGIPNESELGGALYRCREHSGVCGEWTLLEDLMRPYRPGHQGFDDVVGLVIVLVAPEPLVSVAAPAFAVTLPEVLWPLERVA